MNRIINYITASILILLLPGCAHLASKIIPFDPLPEPDGDFTVGTSIYHWQDSTRLEWFSKDDETDKRELMVQIWYPGKKPDNIQPVPYMDNMNERIPEFAKQIGIPAFMFKHFSEVKTKSYKDIEPMDGKFPVVIFSHGLGGMRTQNTIYMQTLASHGYVVAAMDHPYDANITIFSDSRSVLYASNLPEGATDSLAAVIRHRQLNTRSADVSYVINQMEKMNYGRMFSKFQNKLILDRIGVFGHSFGGATSIHSAFHDDRISACLTLDPWYVPVQDEIINAGIQKPFLHIGQPEWDKPLNYERRDDFFQNCGNLSALMTLNETKHFDYMDMPLFTTATQKFGLTGKIESERLLAALTMLHLDFFNAYIAKKGEFEPEYYQNKIPGLIVNAKSPQFSQMSP